MDELVDKVLSRIKIDQKTKCWEWQGAKTMNGYGSITYEKERYYTHRIMHKASKDNLDQEKRYVCHTCDNPKCVNPAHLWAGSPEDNVTDAVEKDRMAGPNYEGEEHHQAQLTEDEVLEIRQKYSQAEYSQKELGKEYGVRRTQIGSIVRGENWQSVDGPTFTTDEIKDIRKEIMPDENKHKQGEKHHNSSLTEDDVIEIREKYHNNSIYQKDLADEYDVARSNIGQIVRGDSWENAGGPVN